jgi:ABC-type bacteriocin/lantibiotic exporter with double-glycine peptidase domain
MAHHGNTPAAWTTVCVALAAFIVAGIALMVGSWPMFWIGCALAPIAVIIGAIMSKMGLNA